MSHNSHLVEYKDSVSDQGRNTDICRRRVGPYGFRVEGRVLWIGRNFKDRIFWNQNHMLLVSFQTKNE